MALQDLRDKRGRIHEEQKALVAKAEAEKREHLTPEETEHFDKLEAEDRNLKAFIERAERLNAAEHELSESRGRKSDPTPPSQPAVGRAVVKDERMLGLEGLRTWLLAGSTYRNKITGEQLALAKQVGFDPNQTVIDLNLPINPMRTVGDARSLELRALGVGTTGAGGFTVPDELMRPLEVAMLTYGGMRRVATVIRTDSGGPLPIPMTNDTGNVGAIVAENATVSQQDVAFTQLTLNAFKYSSKMILVSVELMQDNAVNLASFLGEALGTRIGRITNTHFTVGTGTAQPVGIVTAATLGKQPATTQTATVLFDDFVDLEHSVDPAYRQGARFMMHDTTLRAIKKLKDSQGRPLFLPGLSSTNPDTILGYPFEINQDVAQMATTAKSILFGDLGKYLIRDVLGVTLLRLDERFAEFHQTAFLAFARFDGNLLNAGTNPVKYFQNSA